MSTHFDALGWAAMIYTVRTPVRPSPQPSAATANGTHSDPMDGPSACRRCGSALIGEWMPGYIICVHPDCEQAWATRERAWTTARNTRDFGWVIGEPQPEPREPAAAGWREPWTGTVDDPGARTMTTGPRAPAPPTDASRVVPSVDLGKVEEIEPITLPPLVENIGKPFPASVTDAWQGAWSKPAPPTDAEIVESYTRWQNANDGDPPVNAPVEIRGHRIGMVEFRAAWSRVLAAKVAASDEARRERERRVVMGPIDDPEEV